MQKKMLGLSSPVLFIALFMTGLFDGTHTSELSEEIWLLPDETVDLNCRAERLGAIFENLSTRWEKNKQHVAASAHIEILPDAGLRLTNLRLIDSGVYVCKGRVGNAVVDINTIRLHVGASMQEELMDRGGPWLSNQNPLGIPNVWVAAFLASFIACALFSIIMIIMRVYYKSSVKKYKTYS